MLKSDKKEIIEIRKLDAKNKVAYPIKGTIITRIKKALSYQTGPNLPHLAIIQNLNIIIYKGSHISATTSYMAQSYINL